MSDFLTRACETARASVTGQITPYAEAWYVDGFTTAASRLPSEEEIGRALFDSERPGNERADMTWQEVRGEYLNAARAVRELIEKKMVGTDA